MINDTINPMNFGLTKNLHGHVRVELRDRWTGRVVDSREKDNLVTEAASKIIELMKYYSNTNISFMVPLYSTLFGGLCLFDGTLTEAASNVMFPGNVKLIGLCGYNSDVSHAWSGSMNGSESVATSNGFSTVWDFATSQCNGIIASLARTYSSIKTYFRTERYSIDIAPSSIASQYKPIGYDDATGTLYFANGTTGMYKCLLKPFQLHLFNSLVDISAATTVMTVASSTDGMTYASYYSFDDYEKNFWYINNKTLWRAKTDGTRLGSVALSLPVNVYPSYYYVRCATENYYWTLASTSSTRLFKIQKSNLANITEITLPYSAQTLHANAGDCVVAFNYPSNAAGGNAMLVYSDGSIVTLNSMSGDFRISEGTSRDLGVYMTMGSGETMNQVYWRANNLATIANLDSPVTKTSSQTMKITYTLTET